MKLISRQHDRWTIIHKFCGITALALCCISITFSTTVSGDLLDDSLSPRQQYTMQFHWAHKKRPSGLSRSEFFLQKARIPNVEVRLDTSGYTGQSARIYLKLPEQIDGLAGIAGFFTDLDHKRNVSFRRNQTRRPVPYLRWDCRDPCDG